MLQSLRPAESGHGGEQGCTPMMHCTAMHKLVLAPAVTISQKDTLSANKVSGPSAASLKKASSATTTGN